MSKLALLQQMLDLSTAMAERARHGIWDDVVSLEKQEAALAKQLEHYASSAATARQEAAMIQQILANHTDVRSYVDPWREQVEPLLKALAPQQG
ncbi:MAG TPA: flagellar protein FliT [Rhodocyclaceae bacterium]|nr:flagellar protein FliT [Rhodocyclaceae bacterium]